MRKHMDISRTHGYINFFDASKTKDRKIRGNCNLLAKVKFHVLVKFSFNINWLWKVPSY